MAGDWPSASKRFAAPIGKFQSDVLRLLAARRSPDISIAGGIAINRQGPRFSADIDIFHDSIARHSAFRFFPTQPDVQFGYVLHPVDLVTIHETILPLGAVVAAAVGKFPGTTPEGHAGRDHAA